MAAGRAPSLSTSTTSRSSAQIRRPSCGRAPSPFRSTTGLCKVSLFRSSGWGVRSYLCAIALMSGLVGCVGVIPAVAPESEMTLPEDYEAPVLPLRSLSRREYNNTVRDLLGDTTSPADSFPPEPIGPNGYETGASIGALEAEGYMEAAASLAAAAQRRLPSLLPCAPHGEAEE